MLPGPDYKKPSFDQEQGYQGNGIMQAAGGPGMGSEQVTTDTVRLPFSALFSLITNFCSPKCLIMNLADFSLLVQVMVPDNMVGLIIGRGGEQITRLQVVPENFKIFAGLKNVMTTLKDVSRPSFSGGEWLQDPDVPRQPGNAAQVTARPCFAVKAESLS